MSTQHPDNVHPPFFAQNPVLEGEDEVVEAYYVYSNLGCDEQMWDCEGKEVDSFVVKKLLSRYGDYFRDRQIGRDKFLTLRVPNPEIERTEGKILLETLESIPRSFDLASLFYKNDYPPIFEVILPMTSSFESIDNIYQYYRDFVVGKKDKRLGGRECTVADWVGDIRPDRINVIPLFEDMKSILNSDKILLRYLEGKRLDYQRVFFARSDPAMNYGLIGAVLLNKIGLYKSRIVSEETSVPVLPVIGAGSAPFRGNLRPDTVSRTLAEYPGAWTFTIQSAFKYDYPADEVQRAVAELKEAPAGLAPEISEELCIDIIERYSLEYNRHLKSLAGLVNRIAPYVPQRRKRKLHIGLFGYSRSSDGIELPRAITFTSAMYSIGIPPEILGISILKDKDMDYLHDVYVNFESDMLDSLRYLNPESPYLPEGVMPFIRDHFEYETDSVHNEITKRIASDMEENRCSMMQADILAAAGIRKFIG